MLLLFGKTTIAYTNCNWMSRMTETSKTKRTIISFDIIPYLKFVSLLHSLIWIWISMDGTRETQINSCVRVLKLTTLNDHSSLFIAAVGIYESFIISNDILNLFHDINFFFSSISRWTVDRNRRKIGRASPLFGAALMRCALKWRTYSWFSFDNRDVRKIIYWLGYAKQFCSV